MILFPLSPYSPGVMTNAAASAHQPNRAQSPVRHADTPTHIPPAEGFKIAAADQENLRQLANHIRGIALLWTDSTSAQTISSALHNWTMPIAPDSSYPDKPLSNPSVAQVITRLGFQLPTSLAQAIALRDRLDQKALAPLVGNAGGGLSWPVPLDAAQQQAISDTIDRNSAGLAGLPLADRRKGALDYLLEQTPLSSQELQDPHNAIEKLLKSPRAEALGLAIQTKLGGIATPDSLSEYVLSAIQLGLDRESVRQPGRTRVAGFDWAQEQHWGKPVSSVLEGLKNHLVATGKATPATAPLAAHLLLSRVAPAFLVKDIPDQIVYGSQAHTTFCMAVAKVEQEALGASAKMTYAQVMQRADQIPEPAPEHALQANLIEWGIVSGVLQKSVDGVYTPQQLERVRAAFDDQQNQRLAASESINTDLPTRKGVALAKLKQAFPEMDPALFEKPLLQLDEAYKHGPQPLYDPNLRPVGLYFSMLDVAMGQSPLGKWKTSDKRIPLDKFNNSPARSSFQAFDSEFTKAIDTRKSAIATTVRHLISQLPLEDRKRLETGNIRFFHESTYDGNNVTAKNLVLSFKVEQEGQRSIYQLDIQNLKITRKDNYIDLKDVTWQDGNRQIRQTEFKPKAGGDAAQAERPSTGPALPDSFSSARSHLIANAFVEHLDYDNPAIKQEAMGTTPHERQLQAQDNAREFFLNLIPFRSAIVNFSQGNIADGALDLGLDLFSFLTAGAGTVGKLGKLGSAAVSAGTKYIKGAKVIGAAAIGALNPLDGMGDLLIGAARITGKTGKQLFKGAQALGNATGALAEKTMSTLKGANGSYDLIKASQAHGAASIGTFKSADQTIETVAIHNNDNWYAYDPVKNQPYGGPIQDFQPSYTLAPSPVASSPSRKSRVTPYSVSQRPPRARKPLPEGEYATAMKGKLEPDHFKPDTKFETMKKFVEELFDHYAKIGTNMPPRPPIPTVTKPIPPAELLSQALKTSNGVVLGELHHEMASFKTLFDNAQTLKKEGVKRVYMEGLLSRPDLPDGLQDDGISMLGRTGKPRTSPSFKELKAKLEANGIEIVPLDHYYLTRHKDVKALYGPTKTGFGSEQRLREFNYYATKTIEATSNGEKWVALVGMSHMKTSEAVPGLAEMTGSTAIGVLNNVKPMPSMGYAAKVPAPDPSKPLGHKDYPGDLRIFV